MGYPDYEVSLKEGITGSGPKGSQENPITEAGIK